MEIVMLVRLLLLVLGLFHLANGLHMLLAPLGWYGAVPGVALTGPFNAHFIQDVGMAFIASGAGLLLGARKGRDAALFACAGAAWPALHALIHLDGWAMHGFPADPWIAASEAVGVMGLALLGVALAWLRLKGER
jgi:hypothetical protein